MLCQDCKAEHFKETRFCSITCRNRYISGNNITKVAVKCLYCGKDYMKRKSQSLAYGRSFCCKEHYYRWQKENLTNKVVLICSYWGLSYQTRASRKQTKSCFCSRKCQHKFFVGNSSPSYRTGKKITKAGYVLILKPEHPRKVGGSYVYEHILVMEGHLGRFLEKNEVVHQKNGVKTDNRVENLQIVTPQEHRKIHTTVKIKSDLVGDNKSTAEMPVPSEN